MNKENLLKHKQMTLIDVLHNNNIRTVNIDGTETYMSRERMVEWFDMTEEEVDKLIDACQRLYPAFVAADVARTMALERQYKHKAGAYNFFFDTCIRQGYRFLSKIDLNKIKEFCEVLAEDNYTTYITNADRHQIDRSFERPTVMEALMKCFINKYIDNVFYCIGQGYEWDVICRMSQVDITRERFDEIIKTIDIGD